MKKYVILFIAMFTAILVANAQNYKEGDFNNKQVKAQSIKVGNGWTIEQDYADLNDLDIKFNGILIAELEANGTITGTTAYFRGIGTFTTTTTRTAIYLPGCLATDYYVATPIAPAASGSGSRPVAGDLISVYPKADSLIFMRAAGTTSGGTFIYIRIK